MVSALSNAPCCSGDVDAARNAARELRKQFETVFGIYHAVVYPIVLGIETDEDALIFHGVHGETLNLSEGGLRTERLEKQFSELYPDMKERILRDLMPLVRGNIRHIEEVRKSKRPIVEMDHKEQILGIGRGFDWLHLQNKALLIGPYSFDLTEPIAKAGGILLDNLKSKRIPKDEGFVLLSSAIYRDESGSERLLATEKARALADLSIRTLKRDVPDLIPHLLVLTGTVNENNRLFEPLVIGSGNKKH